MDLGKRNFKIATFQYNGEIIQTKTGLDIKLDHDSKEQLEEITDLGEMSDSRIEKLAQEVANENLKNRKIVLHGAKVGDKVILEVKHLI